MSRMPSSAVTRIAVDVMGGDFAPDAVLQGVSAALAADPSLKVLLVGAVEIVEPFAAGRERCHAVVTTQVVEMGEHPAAAVRGKPDASIVVGCRLVKDGRADAFFSAGNTGATMAAATLIIGRIKGVQRPAIATVLPTAGAPCILLDVGANADARPEHLAQFATMGAAYAKAALGIVEPRVGLLNIGTEPAKGSQLAQDAYELLQGTPGFAGNVEGNDIPAGTVDVVVTDGFTGNVALKLMEGMSKHLLGEFKATLMSSPVNKVAAAVLGPSLGTLRDKLDPDVHGAAPLLGIDGLALIGHGSSSPKAIASALRVGAVAVRAGLVGSIAAALGREGA
jgi:glycerol-3-phosphate acyltransferase PlsX